MIIVYADGYGKKEVQERKGQMEISIIKQLARNRGIPNQASRKVQKVVNDRSKQKKCSSASPWFITTPPTMIMNKKQRQSKLILHNASNTG